MLALENIHGRATARPYLYVPAEQDEIETMGAELAAILVDLEARARYGRIEGVAVPLLVHAKTVNDQIRQRLESASAVTRERWGPTCARLDGQLRTVAMSLAALCRGSGGAHAA